MFWGTIGYISSTLLVQKRIHKDDNNDKSGHIILGIFAILVFFHIQPLQLIWYVARSIILFENVGDYFDKIS